MNRVPVPATGHTEVTDAAVPPTCTESGKTEGKHCSVCGEIIVAQQDVPATGHDWRTFAETDSGVIERCYRCGEEQAFAKIKASKGEMNFTDRVSDEVIDSTLTTAAILENGKTIMSVSQKKGIISNAQSIGINSKFKGGMNSFRYDIIDDNDVTIKSIGLESEEGLESFDIYIDQDNSSLSFSENGEPTHITSDETVETEDGDLRVLDTQLGNTIYLSGEFADSSVQEDEQASADSDSTAAPESTATPEPTATPAPTGSDSTETNDNNDNYVMIVFGYRDLSTPTPEPQEIATPAPTEEEQIQEASTTSQPQVIVPFNKETYTPEPTDEPEPSPTPTVHFNFGGGKFVSDYCGETFDDSERGPDSCTDMYGDTVDISNGCYCKSCVAWMREYGIMKDYYKWYYTQFMGWKSMFD